MVRVIAGAARGARLRAPKGLSTRPTADRVKEALFNILGDVAGASVLDLFAGTGALGIEALSRGSSFAVFVERDGRTAQVIRGNLVHTKLEDRAAVVRAEVPVDPARLVRWSPFTLVFMDPPYDTGCIMPTLSWLCGSGLLADGALIALERSRMEEIASPPKNMRAVREKVYGPTVLNIFAYSE